MTQDLNPHNIRDDELQAILNLARENLQGSLHTFMKSAWHLVEGDNEFIDGWHLHAICEHLEACQRGDIRNLIINMPPRHCKSTLCSVFFPLWTWINDPSTKWLCSSYSHGLAVRDSVKTRRVMQTPWFRLRFPECDIAPDQNQKARFELTGGGVRVATTVLGAATGEGGDFIQVDDPHKVLDSQSEKGRDAVIDWWDQTMSTRGNDPKTARRIVIGQRVHFGDLCGHLEDLGGYEKLTLPAEYDGSTGKTSIGWRDPRKKDGELLWPDRFSRDDIEILKKSLGTFASSAQLQQRPVPQDGGMVSDSWIEYCEDLPEKFDRVIQSWDTAFKAGPGSFVCGQVWGAKDNKYYLMDQERGRWGFTQTIAAIERLSRRHPDCTEILIEDAANGPAIIDTLKRSLNGIIPVRPDGSKVARFSAVSPLFEAGQVVLHKKSPFLQDFLTELLQFPLGRNDDQVDAASQALRRISQYNSAEHLFPRKRMLRLVSTN